MFLPVNEIIGSEWPLNVIYGSKFDTPSISLRDANFYASHTLSVQSSDALTKTLSDDINYSPLNESICDFKQHLF